MKVKFTPDPCLPKPYGASLKIGVVVWKPASDAIQIVPSIPGNHCAIANRTDHFEIDLLAHNESPYGLLPVLSVFFGVN